MGAISNYLEEKWLSETFVTKAVYLALFTSDPTDADSGVELFGGGYQRQRIHFAAPIQVGGKGQIQNEQDAIFPQASTDLGKVTHFGIYDAATKGNLLFHGALTTPKTIETNDQLTFYAGNIKLSLD
ncbi:MAG TPA: hypothetical protein GX497_13750 [Bacillus bacterium]|nr:hypothetical protein [Bacillus sp. (in: firmicutes)]